MSRRPLVVHAAQLPDTRRSPYAPGSIRAAADREQEAVSRFLGHYPEYGRLSHAALVTMAETYRDDHDLALREDMREQGVPVDDYTRTEDVE